MFEMEVLLSYQSSLSHFLFLSPVHYYFLLYKLFLVEILKQTTFFFCFKVSFNSVKKVRELNLIFIDSAGASTKTILLTRLT